MEYHDDYFYTIVRKKLTGGTSPDEENYVQEMLTRYPQARELYDELVAMHEDKDFRLVEPRDSKHALASIIRSGQKIKRKKRVRVLSLTSLLVLAILGGVYYFSTHQTAGNVHHDHGITLQLADGSKIVMPGEKDTLANIHTGSAVLHADSATLNFTAFGTGRSANAWNTLTVPIGKTYTVVLADSTIVHLNADTKIQFPFSFASHTREIAINGEAYIDVTQRPNHPFIVHTPHSTIEVLGTQFNINTYDSGTVRVALVEGALRVKGGSRQVTIRPGQEAIYEAGGDMSVRHFEKDIRTGWLKGIYYFENQDLENIAVVIKRWYGVEIIFDDPALSKEKFAGVLDKNQSLSVFLTNLAAMSFSNGVKIDYYYDKGVLHIHRKGRES